MTSTSATVHPKRIALTFDDVPRFPGPLFTVDERTAEIVRRLDLARVEQVGFFVIVGNLQQPFGTGGEQRIADYVDAGHVVGNHGHDHLALSATCVDDYLRDVDEAERWLAVHPGHRAWFRYPYLDEGDADPSKRSAVHRALGARGLRNAYITVVCNDQDLDQMMASHLRSISAEGMSALGRLYARLVVGAAEFYHALSLEHFERSPAHVVLLHETDLNACYIDVVVTALRTAGWVIISIDEAYDDPIAELEPAPGYGSSRISGLCRTDVTHAPTSTAGLTEAFRELLATT